MRTSSSCSADVKRCLFRSYCSNFYCSHLWYNFTKVQMNKLRITYNNAMRHLFNLHFRCSASEMFANCNIHSMDEVRRTCILYSFIQRLKCCSNAIITCFMSYPKYRNVPYGIIGLNVYIYICRPFLLHLYGFLKLTFGRNIQ